ncbi:transcriptional regulator, y4mF family [Aedoeadaptatus ivorii]|uniref:Transcriptional regulator, y4mF family n=1 Tax=Aedoeadaptatus ivorii TaxID=54006 RepID=A0A3S4YV45_9FIRM|nr:helix-turn-helix transcriptional regulator [Peptoniphilus ivorii]MDQ0507633.1 transcriptional regulator with XRE-family HTH domain [Peptoniphilus ivorii]VEJ35305.1 transcriptional regulator, y4mF family [Peptoniphilus ivorii]
MRFGDKIKILRTEKGWIQQELADAVGVSVRTIKNYELGDSYPKNRLIYKKLAEIFSVDVNYLLTEDEGFAMPDKSHAGYDDYRALKQASEAVHRVFQSEWIQQKDKDVFLRKVWEWYWEEKE